MAKSAVLPEALSSATVNCTQLPWRRKRQPAGPYGAFPILKERRNNLPSKFRVLSQLAVLPTCQPLPRADPKSPVARDQEPPNISGGELLARRRLPQDGADSVEPIQAEFCTQPEISVGCLLNRCDCALGEAVADLPRGVRVLADVQRRIQRGHTRGADHNHGRQKQ